MALVTGDILPFNYLNASYTLLMQLWVRQKRGKYHVIEQERMSDHVWHVVLQLLLAY